MNFTFINMKYCLHIFLLILFWTFATAQGCTKVMVYGKNYDTDIRKTTFSNSREDVVAAIKKIFDQYGYQVHLWDEEGGKFVSGWRPTEAESHYFNLFDRKDYGVADGAYYRLVIDVVPENKYQKVMIATTVKTVAGKLHSSGRLESKILNQMSNYLQASQIEMTNVGVDKK